MQLVTSKLLCIYRTSTGSLIEITNGLASELKARICNYVSDASTTS